MSDSLQQKLKQRKKKIAARRKRFNEPPAVGTRTGLRSQDDTPPGSEHEDSASNEDYVSPAELFEVNSPIMTDEIKEEKKTSAAVGAQLLPHDQQPSRHTGQFGAATSSSSQQADFKGTEEQRYDHVIPNIERVFQDMCDKVLRQQEELSNVVRAVDKRLSTIESRPTVAFPEVTSQSQGASSMVHFTVPPPPQAPVVDAMAEGGVFERQPTPQYGAAPSAHAQSTPKRRRSNSLSTPRNLLTLPEETDGEPASRRRKNDGSSRNRKQSKAVNKSKDTSKSRAVDTSSCTIESDDDSETSETASTTSSTGAKFVKNINLKVPRFNGKNFHIFKPRFEAVARRRGLNDEQKCDLLTQVLEGDAERVLAWVLPEHWSYETLMKEAELQFTDNKSYSDVLTELLYMRRKAGESLHEFAHKVQQTSRQAEMREEERQRLTRQAFVIGLADYPLMRAYVEREDKTKDSLRTAVALAVKYEKEHCMEKTDRTTAKVTTETQHDDNDEADVNRFFTQRGQSYRGRGRGGFHGGRDQRTLEDEIAKLREEMAQLKLSQGATTAQPVSEKSNVEGEKKQYYDKKSSRWNYRGMQRGRGRSRFWQYVNGQYVPYNPQQQPQFKEVQAATAFPPPPPVLPQQPAPTTTAHHVPVQHMAAQTVAPPILYEDAADDDEQPSDEQE